MSIIINNKDALTLPKYLETAFGSVEMLDCTSNLSKRNSGFQTDNNCSHSIIDIMSTRNRELYLAQRALALIHCKDNLTITKFNVRSRVITSRLDTISYDLTIQLRQQVTDILVIATNNRFAIRFNLIQKLHIGILQPTEIPTIVLQVIRFNIRDNPQ
ncbi:hypothetical protein D3C77_566940 [compost metagenome]